MLTRIYLKSYTKISLFSQKSSPQFPPSEVEDGGKAIRDKEEGGKEEMATDPSAAPIWIDASMS
jgi:hypothetical protein